MEHTISHTIKELKEENAKLLYALKELSQVVGDYNDAPMPMAFYRALEAISKSEGR